jgi:hypothetical protein
VFGPPEGPGGEHPEKGQQPVRNRKGRSQGEEGNGLEEHYGEACAVGIPGGFQDHLPGEVRGAQPAQESGEADGPRKIPESHGGCGDGDGDAGRVV